jgi:hypothetical protein
MTYPFAQRETRRGKVLLDAERALAVPFVFFATVASAIWEKFNDFSENAGSRGQFPADIELGIKFVTARCKEC